MHSKSHHACVIIDDPLLRENYGFLNYRKLLELMDRHNFFTTIAFIPFNFRRTDNKIAALFRERPDRFSLCVHGCDHTGGEFANTDPDFLERVVKIGHGRMIEHEKRTGVPFDRVMVFPQGRFSNAALEALKRNGYLGAVNTVALPTDGRIESDFPFFLRYKPEDVGEPPPEPLFVVLHHEYFKDGYDKLTGFVDNLNERLANIKWGSVGNILRSHLATVEPDKARPETRQDDLSGIDLEGFEFYGWKENIKIRMRRYASEFRDNYLSRNDFVFNAARKIKNSLKI